MAANIQCPHCGATYQLTDEQAPQYAGQTINCTQCGKPFAVSGDFSTQAIPMTPPAMPGTVSYATPAHVQYAGNGLAITALVCGIFGFLILPGIIAIIFGILVLQRKRNSSPGGKGMAIAGIATGFLSMLMLGCMISILLPSLNRARGAANRIKCASNMKMIGLSLAMYANENRGVYPPRLEALMLDQQLAAEALTCPASNDTAAPGSTAAQQAKNLSTGGHLSYVYVGNGLTSNSPADVVVLYEPISNHSNDGSNFLYGDGHVEFLQKPTAQQMISNLQAGRNPPVLNGSIGH